MGRIKDLLIDFIDLVSIKVNSNLSNQVLSEVEVEQIATEIADAWLNSSQVDYTDLTKMNLFTKNYLNDYYAYLCE